MQANQKFDTIVVGLGAMGSATLLQLAQKGIKVLGIDQFRPPHIQGSTHGGSRVTRQAYYEDPAYVPLLIRSYELWEDIGQKSGKTLFRQTGGLMMSDEAGEIAQRSLAAAQAYDLPHTYLSHRQLREQFPMFNTAPGTEGLLEHRAGMLDPEACVEAQLTLAEAAGATCRFGEKMMNWEASAQGVLVDTDQGRYQAEKLVLSLGPWAMNMAEALGVPLHIDRIAQFFLQPIGPISTYAPDRFPLFLWIVEKDLGYYGFPAVDGPKGGLKLSFYPYGDHPVRQLCTAESIDREISAKDEADIRHYTQTFMPDLNGEVVRTLTCMHTNSPDYHPVIGLHPQHDQVALAFGFSGHGFKFSNVVGELLADLILGGASSWELDLFSPGRFTNQPV